MVTPAFSHDSTGTPRSAWTGHPAWRDVAELELTGADGRPLTRVVVVAAHPDDESLGAAGLLAAAARSGLEVVVVVLTGGEESHPRSPTHGRELLAARRLEESRAALRAVAPDAELIALGIPDGQVADAEDEVVRTLVRLVGDGRSTLLVSPWRHDGHADHDACGRAAAVVARRTGTRLVQFPVWLWHWGDPAALPWTRLRRLHLPAADRAAKRAAIEAHETQVRPLSGEPGDERLLGEEFLAHFTGEEETFIEEEGDDDALDALHQRTGDPWGVDTTWYERRKRALTCAVLPQETYRRGLEVGCSTGALAADLAPRCQDLLAADSSAAAIAAARARLADLRGVVVEQRDLPREWPDGIFDLIVVSEVGYFMTPAGLDLLVERIQGSLAPDGDLVLCHWRHPIEGWPLDGPDVLDRVRTLLPRPEVAHHVERDFDLAVFSEAFVDGPDA